MASAEPIGPGVVLLTMARSRSSMTAEILRRHGVFFGDTWMRDDKRVGYNEHKWFKQQARQIRGDSYDRILQHRDPALRMQHFADRWQQQLLQEGYEQGPWGVKVDAFCWPVFAGMDITPVKIWRRQAAIEVSCMNALGGGRSAEDWTRIIDAHHGYMRRIDGPDIWTDQVVTGDYDSLAMAFAAAGIDFDPAIATEVIE